MLIEGYSKQRINEQQIQNIFNMFTNKTLLITGGTGSFGNAVLNRFIDSTIKEIRIFSRDEKKQDDMRQLYRNEKIKYYLGDTRDKRSLDNAMRGVDYVFQAAALKQVPSCEFFPMEAVRTNVLGAENVLDSALEHDVKNVIVLSTDKAVYPINAMGMSKALSEKVMVAKSRNLNGCGTTYCGTRYGNVMASRGSVIPLFVDQIKSDYRLQPSSTCIDAGTSEGAPDKDIKGINRPQGTGYDMGAYEFVLKAMPWRLLLLLGN